MEEHAVVEKLRQSREQIRELLMPGAASGRILPGHFPRSAVMRFLVDSRKRGMAMTAVATAFAFFGRGRRPGESQARWPRIRQALLPLLDQARRR